MSDENLKRVAAGAQPSPGSMPILDLSAVRTQSQNMVSPRMTIPYDTYVGNGSVLGTEEVKRAAKERVLESPTPPALILVPVDEEPNALWGIPTMEKNPAYLPLTWIEQGRRFRANMQAVLQAKSIRIPADTNMVISLTYQDHPKWGHCVKLSWAGDCFEPIEKENEEAAKKRSQGK